MTTTEQQDFDLPDHDAATRHAERIVKRGSGYTHASKNLAHAYMQKCMMPQAPNAVEQLDQAEELAQLRDEVDRYRELAHELAFMVANLTSSKVPQ